MADRHDEMISENAPSLNSEIQNEDLLDPPSPQPEEEKRQRTKTRGKWGDPQVAIN